MLNNNLDKQLSSLLLFIDFRKAFDLVNPSLLLHKLVKYGFSKPAVDFLAHYFDSRLQAVKLNDDLSDFVSINLGVPQGSVLGPLLFLIFINDLPHFLKEFYCILFADDTTLCKSSKDIQVLISSFLLCLHKLIDWCNHNLLDINWKKTFFMFVTNLSYRDLPSEIIVNNISIKVVDKFKLRGIIVDAKLNFLNQASGTCPSLKLNSIQLNFVSFTKNKT